MEATMDSPATREMGSPAEERAVLAASPDPGNRTCVEKTDSQWQGQLVVYCHVKVTLVAYCDVGLQWLHPAMDPTLWHQTQTWCADDAGEKCGLQPLMGGQLQLALIWIPVLDCLGC